tara:strand:- start:582 stop:1529 length:948 start_codon:yes stop_codon:yes gene_type:complete
MITNKSKIGVTSRTFSRSEDLRKNLEKNFSNVKYNQDGIHFNEDNLVSFLSDCEGAIISGENLSRKVIDQLPNLRIVSKFGVGVDTIDVKYLQKKGIYFHWRPGTNANSVAELALSYIILMTREAQILNRELISGNWSKVKNSKELSELVIGIIGFGEIGRRLAQYLMAHKSDILVYDPYIQNLEPKSDAINFISLNKLLRKSDAVSLHLPLTNETEGLINKDKLKMMKKGSFLINLSRGGIVNEQDLIDALRSEHLGGAAVDVFKNEPSNCPKLVELRTCFSTPHIAGTSNYASSQLGLNAINGLIENIKTNGD